MRVAFCSAYGRGALGVLAGLSFALAAAGCSNTSRFDYPTLGLTGDTPAQADMSTTASVPVPSEPVYASSARSGGSLQRTAAYSPSQPRYYGTPKVNTPPPAPPPVANVSGPRVTVQQGDTLSGLSQRYGVPIHTIQTANNLSDGRLRAGQVLVLPGARMAAATPPAPAMQSATMPVPAAQTPPPSSARKVTTTTIQPPTTPAAAPAATTTAAKPAASTVATNAQLPAPEPMAGNSFRWPVKGRIISGFGTNADGGHNDGINISVPQGTPVLAAENGVVAYAGNELKGYGNLVLVRHANNWVSAYANNESILVKRGQKVQRGQTIAKAGTSGSVDRPQVHFELRKGSRPVDPMKYMSSMSAQAN